MIRGVLSALTVLSLVVFPWLYTVGLALITAAYEPLVPLAVGILADTLYYVPHSGVLPWGTIGGALVTGAALFVQSRLRTSSIG